MRNESMIKLTFDIRMICFLAKRDRFRSQFHQLLFKGKYSCRICAYQKIKCPDVPKASIYISAER